MMSFKIQNYDLLVTRVLYFLLCVYTSPIFYTILTDCSSFIDCGRTSIITYFKQKFLPINMIISNKSHLWFRQSVGRPSGRGCTRISPWRGGCAPFRYSSRDGGAPATCHVTGEPPAACRRRSCRGPRGSPPCPFAGSDCTDTWCSSTLSSLWSRTTSRRYS